MLLKERDGKNTSQSIEFNWFNWFLLALAILTIKCIKGPLDLRPRTFHNLYSTFKTL